MQNVSKIFIVAAWAMLPVAANAAILWVGGGRAYDTLDGCLKNNHRCKPGKALVEVSSIEAVTKLRGSANQTDVIYYTRVRSGGTDIANVWKHYCLGASGVGNRPCSKDEIDILIDARANLPAAGANGPTRADGRPIPKELR